MGHLRHYNLQRFIDEFDTKIFVETGVGGGDGIMEAQKCGFQRIISIEIMPQQVVKMREKFKDDPRVTILEGDTLAVLPDLLRSTSGNICFWLDAHYPGADIGLGKHDDRSVPNDTRLPLERELTMIRELRFGKDVVLFDDLKIYRNQGRDCWRADIKPWQEFSSDRFFEEILHHTHDFVSDDADTGYATLTPKQK